MANEHADEGDTINVTISTTGETSISTLGLRLYYDKEKLVYQRSQWTGNKQNSDSLMMLVSDVEYSGSQVLNISMISDGGYQSGSALVTLVFTVKEGYAENPFKLELREITDENLQSVKPAASIVYQNTENGSGEGTGLSGEVTLENDTLTYGEPLSKLVFHDAAFVDSDNKAVDGSLAWKNPEEIPNAGTISAIWVFTPSDSQYETLEGTISIIVNKAENAPNMPDSSMSVSNSIKKVGDIPLPEGWEWQETDRDTALETDTTITARAVYIGVDKGNYENETVMVAIKRLPCDHVYISKVTKEPTADVEGIMTYTCSKCGDTYTERIP
ncbi:MAG: hypothetical protein K2M91_13670, partial [Lachnospiraceae bacterium]|nr:hypothetical protein [Lachnospiraceae bacterium]